MALQQLQVQRFVSPTVVLRANRAATRSRPAAPIPLGRQRVAEHGDESVRKGDQGHPQQSAVPCGCRRPPHDFRPRPSPQPAMRPPSLPKQGNGDSFTDRRQDEHVGRCQERPHIVVEPVKADGVAQPQLDREGFQLRAHLAVAHDVQLEPGFAIENESGRMQQGGLILQLRAQSRHVHRTPAGFTGGASGDIRHVHAVVNDADSALRHPVERARDLCRVARHRNDRIRQTARRCVRTIGLWCSATGFVHAWCGPGPGRRPPGAAIAPN